MDYRRPDRIDWSYLQSVLDASTEEALNDLQQLRSDSEYWSLRIQQTGKNTSNLLYSVFSRINTFVCLSERIKRVRLCNGWTDSSISYDDIGLFKEAVSLDPILRSILNKALESIQKMRLSSDWTWKGTKTFRYLSDMMEENDPTLRVIGLRSVLRTIEREMPKVNPCDSMPFLFAQALNDMSVVAVCMQESDKHYQYIRSVSHEYTSLANDAESEWNGREQPWISFIEGTLHRLKHKINKLNLYISDEVKPLEERHKIFWNTIDAYMLDGTAPRPIVDFIRHYAPISAAPTSASVTSPMIWSTHGTEVALTETQKRKSKGRKSRHDASRSLRRPVTASNVVELHSLPFVRIQKDADKIFWNRLSSDKGQIT
ncbi:hypothetical protein AnigIFM63604_005040, partial [Aspergillus niger]